MNYVVVGVNHKTAPVAVREKLAFTPEDHRQALSELRQAQESSEWVVLSTCNRVEIYGLVPDPNTGAAEIGTYFRKKLSGHDADASLYSFADREAVAHLFRVTASLDSLVVGENQIPKQVKEAHQMAMETLASGPYLNRLFNRALFVAKRVKTETEIGKGNVSVGSAGVALAKKIFGSLRDHTITLLGAGEIGELVLRYLNDSAKGRSFIINRSPEKAKTLEDEGLGVARPIEDLEKALQDSDILITSVSGKPENLNVGFFSEVMEKRRNAPLFIIDLGVPRNVDSKVGEIDNVYLYDIDDLKAVAEENRSQREGEMISAENIIDEETRLFYEDHLDNRARPTIAGLNRKFDEIRRREFEKTLAKLGHLSAEDQAQIETMSKAIVARILRGPILSLKGKESADSPLAGLMRKIFSLDDEVDDE